MEAASRGSSRIASLPLQLRQASQGTEIRTRGQDAGNAGGIDLWAADVQGDLLLDDAFFGAAKCHGRFLRLRLVGQCGRFAPFNGSVATPDGGSTQGAPAAVLFQAENRSDVRAIERSEQLRLAPETGHAIRVLRHHAALNARMQPGDCCRCAGQRGPAIGRDLGRNGRRGPA